MRMKRLFAVFSICLILFTGVLHVYAEELPAETGQTADADESVELSEYESAESADTSPAAEPEDESADEATDTSPAAEPEDEPADESADTSPAAESEEESADEATDTSPVETEEPADEADFPVYEADPSSAKGAYEYAVLGENNILTFFESDYVYDDFEVGTCIDNMGKMYQGVICSVTNDFRAYKLEAALNVDINYIRVADGSTIDSMTSMSMWFWALDELRVFSSAYGYDTSHVTDMSFMFGNCIALESADLSGFDTSNVEYMNNMFQKCESLIDVNVNSLDTSSVLTMTEMFDSCSSLVNLDLSELDTSSLTEMESMLDSCKALKYLYLDGFDTSNVYKFDNVFYGCESLEYVDLSSFNTEIAYSFKNMFRGCSSMTELNLSSFYTPYALDMSYMFWGCTSLEMLDIEYFDTSREPSMEGMFGTLPTAAATTCPSLRLVYLGSKLTYWDPAGALPSLANWEKGSRIKSSAELCEEYPANAEDWSGFWRLAIDYNEYAVLTSGGGLTFIESPYSYTEYEPKIIMDIYHNVYAGMCCKVTDDFRASELQTIADTEIKSVMIAPGSEIDHMTKMDSWFSDLTSLTYFAGNGFHTENVTSMNGLFEGCSALEEVDITSMDTSNVKDMGAMFSGCSSLDHISLYYSNTSNVEFMYQMFQGCSSLTTLDLSRMDTGAAHNFVGMFAGCTSLIELDLSSFNTQSVTMLSGMFDNCTSLERVDLSSFDTQDVWTYSYMFDSCVSLKELDLSGFDTTNANNMNCMFADCTSLTELDLSTWETPNLQDTASMFSGCTSLKKLDISNFDTSSVENMVDMFGPAVGTATGVLSKLTSVKIGPKFTTWPVNAALPDLGTWTNGTLEKTAAELCAEYPANAADWAGTWQLKSEAAPSNITSTSVNFSGKLYLNTYILPSDEVKEDPGAYVRVTFNGVTTDHNVQKLMSSDTTYDSQGRIRVGQEVKAAMMHDVMTLQLFNGQGEAMPLTYKNQVDVTDGFNYTVVEYLRGRLASSNPKMVRLAKEAELYGIAVQVKFGYKLNQLTKEDVAAVKAEAAQTTIPSDYAEVKTGTLPDGITKQTSTVMFEADNTLRLYFYFDDTNLSKYTFKIDGETVKAKKLESGKYYIEKKNIASGELSTPYTFSVTDGKKTYTVRESALSYAYGRQEKSTDESMRDLAKLLYQYSQAADAYFK